MKKNNAETLAELNIQRLIDALLRLFNTCNSRNGDVQRYKMERQALDDHNPEFFEIRNDFRERNKMWWRLLNLLLASLVDYLLLYGAIVILCTISGFPLFLKYVIPPVLIVMELSVSYFTSLRQRYDRGKDSKVYKWLPYFVLFILTGLSMWVVIYALVNYDPAVNGNSIFGFAVGTILGQVFLLVSSLMYHVWLIRHAEEIAEMFGYAAYISKRAAVTRIIDNLEKGNRDRYGPEFTQEARNLVENMETFKRDYPTSGANFASTIPADLARAINAVMGRQAVQIETTGMVK